MYENVTFEGILKRMLDRIPDGLDKREGSIIYDALAPAAAELQNLYIQLDVTRDLTFVGSSSSIYLDALAGEYGLSRIPATNAVVKGVFNMDVPIGSRFSGGLLNYAVTEKVSDGVFLLDCETAGVGGNAYTGRLIPIDYIDGLTLAEITEISIPAADTETDESLKARFFDTIKGGAMDGNVRQYLKWAAEYPGVGRAAVSPLWNGPNTVKVSILNAENGAASEELIAEFQDYLDPGCTGLGNGVAPIGAIVTVGTATEKRINVNVSVRLNTGYTTYSGVEDALKAYLQSLAYASEYVSFYGIAYTITNCDSVAQIATLTVNSGRVDVKIAAGEIPILGDLNVQVVTS